MIEIKVTAHPDHGVLREQIVASMAALGFTPEREVGKHPALAAPYGGHPMTAPGAAETKPAKAEKADKPKKGAKADEPKQSIQTGEERAGPEDTAEEQAQDQADENADKEDAAEVSHDTVRGVLGEYVKRYGMPAAQEDGPKVISLMFGKDKSKVSDIPDDQESLKKAVAGVSEMLAKNPYKREPVKGK